MIQTEIDEEMPLSAPTNRSGGVHLSDVLQDIEMEVFGRKSGDIDAVALAHFEKGFLWERLLERAYGDAFATRPGEITVDGIIMTPDGIDTDADGVLVVEEFKATAMSSARTPADKWRWRMQAACYCRAVGATVAIFRVFYVKDIGFAGVKPYRVFRLEFTQQELDDAWETVVAHAKTKWGV